MTKKWSLYALMTVFLGVCASCSPSPSATKDAEVPQPTLEDAVYQQAFAELVVSAKNWSQLPEGDKHKVVAEVIKLFRDRENVAILKETNFYVTQLDDAVRTGAFPIDSPLPNLIKLFAVMEFDFYNGQNKDDLAKQILGDQLYQGVKERRARLNL